MAGSTSKPYLLHIFEDRVVFEKVTDGGPSPCLVIARSLPEAPLDIYVDPTGKVLKDYRGGQLIPVDAIFGIYHLLSGPYVALVIDSEVVVSHGTIEYRRVTKAAIIPLIKSGLSLRDEKQADEDRYLELLHAALSAHVFYFSYTHDVTHTLQRCAKLSVDDKKKPLWLRADERFFWNMDLLGDLMAAKAHDFILPMMNAFLEFRPNCSVNVHKFHLLFVSRRARHRQGCRFTMRGIDEEGHVANFVETEQALLHADGRQNAFVQIRGSIPLLWNSPVCMKYTPKVFVGDMHKSVALARKHMDSLLETYGKEGVIFVNLVNMKKDEQTLGIKFKEVVDKQERRNLRYVWFDFHAECKKMKFQNLYKLLKDVDEDFGRHSFFARGADGVVTKTQKGVVRTNCLDNLDRTNVVQSLFARRSLLMQLEQPQGLQGNVLESPYKDFEAVFKDVWGNNADAISTYYSGTGALKTDFTRTGKRTMRGVIQDGVNSVMRYYKNNFTDGTRQDAIDLMLGRFKPDSAAPSPFLHPPAEQESVASFLTKLFTMLVAIFAALMLLRPEENALQKLVVAAGVTLVIFLVMVYNMVKKGGKMGKKLVCKPRLCPEPYVYSFFASAH